MINFGRNSIATILPQYLYLPSPGFAVSSELLSYIMNTQSLAIILLGLIVGGLLGFIGTLLLLIKIYGWAMDDYEEEWRERRKEWEQERKKNDKTSS